MSEDWTEKYRPRALKEVVGNPKAVDDLRKWAESWGKKGSKKAVVLSGTPGIGKTSAAHALANDMGWGIVEMNASDKRTGADINEIAMRGSLFNTFNESGEYLDEKSGGRKLIILDEADNFFGNADRGAMPAIARLIKETKQPIVLIVNDYYALSRKSSAVKNAALQIKFQKPQAASISKTLKSVAEAEGVSAEAAALDAIAANSNGDMRAAVRDLQSLALGRDSIVLEDTKNLSSREAHSDIYALMYAIFRGSDPMEARKTMRAVDEDIDHIILWVDENLPTEYVDNGDLVRGYEKLSKADIFMGRVGKRRHFRLWAYAGDLTSAGVCSAKKTNKAPRDRFRFPGYLMTMSRSKKTRETRASACSKIGALTHNSISRVSEEILPYLRIMMARNPPLKRRVVEAAGLDEEELAYILETDFDSETVREAFETEQPKKTKKVVPVVEEALVRPEPPASQKSLFQF